MQSHALTWHTIARGSDITRRHVAQDFGAELIFGTSFFACTHTLASRLDVPIVNFLPAAPIEPFLTSLWRGSNRRLFTSNPLSYVPQMELDFTTQYLVRSRQPSWTKCLLEWEDPELLHCLCQTAQHPHKSKFINSNEHAHLCNACFCCWPFFANTS